MINCKWKAPNYRFKAKDPGGKPKNEVVFAESEVILRARLSKGLFTDIEIEEYDFDDWLSTAKEKTAEIEEHFKTNGNVITYNPDEKIWKALKYHLFELFGKRCAYCEAGNIQITAAGDVDHYRPKKKVTDADDHPGYYWLIYDHANYLPSCENCNRSVGKWNQFPVKSGTRAKTKAEIANEIPLLLNPWTDEPRKHLLFTQAGNVVPREGGDWEKADKTIKVLKLRRGNIHEERFAAMKIAKSDVDTIMSKDPAKVGEAIKKTEQALLLNGKSYIAASLDELDRVRKKIIEDLSG